MSNTLGIHWSATTHGTWLHGDPRGSWRHGRLIGPDPFLEASARSSLSNNAIVLSDDERLIVAAAFGEVIREHRYRALAATVQRTHVHIVFAPLAHDVKTVIDRLKRRSTMKRNTRNGSVSVMHSTSASLWTAGQFPIFIFSEEHLANAIEYVRDHNRRIDLPADPFDWIEPLYAASGEIGGRANLRPGEQLRF